MADTIKAVSDSTKHGMIIVNPDGSNVGGGVEYNATPPTLADGGTDAVQADSAGNTKVREQYQPKFEDNSNGVAKVEMRGTYSYQATAGTNKVVLAAPGFLYGVIIGKDVASAAIDISDHASSGSGAVKVHVEGSTLMTSLNGYLPVNASFSTGITADLTNQTNVTFIYRADA